MELRVTAEAAGNLARCITTTISVLIFHQTLYAFAYGQLAFSFIYMGTYYLYFCFLSTSFADLSALKRIFNSSEAHSVLPFGVVSLFPRCFSAKKTQKLAQLESKTRLFSLCNRLFTQFDPRLLSLTTTFIVQSAEKLLLTEGEKAIMLILSPLTAEEQGIYGAVQNLGSLVLRFLFQPIEEALSAQFSKYAASVSSQSFQWSDSFHALKNRPNSSVVSSSRTIPLISVKNYSILCQMKTMLETLSSLVSIAALFLAVFSPANSHILFDVVYGSRWALSTAPITLSVYTFSLYTFGLNGILEAFLFAVAPTHYIKAMNRVLVFLSFMYLIMCTVFSAVFPEGYGAQAFIIANAITMICRITLALRFSSQYFGFPIAKWVEIVTSTPAQICGLPTQLCDPMLDSFNVKSKHNPQSSSTPSGSSEDGSNQDNEQNKMICVVSPLYLSLTLSRNCILAFLIAMVSSLLSFFAFVWPLCGNTGDFWFGCSLNILQKDFSFKLKLATHLSIQAILVLTICYVIYKNEKDLFRRVKLIFQKKTDDSGSSLEQKLS